MIRQKQKGKPTKLTDHCTRLLLETQKEDSHFLGIVRYIIPIDSNEIDDKRSFETLYLRYRNDLLTFIVRRYRLDESTAEDILSDVFLRFYQRRRHIQIKGNLRNYLMSMTRNAVADWFEKHADDADSLSVDVPSLGVSPEEAVEMNEIAREIGRAVDSLTESQRLAMELSESGLSYKQIAAIHNCTEKAAQRRVEKAREQLRQALSHCGPSCVLGTPQQDQCPAKTNNIYCLKYFIIKQMCQYSC